MGRSVGSSRVSARTRRFLETALAEEPERLRERMRRARVRISLDGTFAASFTAQLVAFTLVNLLIRLGDFFPVTELVVPEVPRHPQLRMLKEDGFAAALRSFFAPFAAAERLAIVDAPSAQRPTITVTIAPDARPGSLQVWAEGWLAYLNATRVRRMADTNPIGACVAAGFAAAEILKELVGDAPLQPGVRIVRNARLVFSAYDHGLAEGSNPPLPPEIDLGSTLLVGAGGIASAFTFGAAALPALAGALTIVDDDDFDDTNENRHLVAPPGATGPKALWCANVLSFAPGVRAEVRKVQDHYASLDGHEPDLVALAVDDDGVRRWVQGRLPRVLLNAATGEIGDIRLSRHTYTQGACLRCVAVADLAPGDPTIRALARRLHLPYEVVQTYDQSAEPLPRSLLGSSGRLADADLERFGERTTREIWQLIYNEAPVAVKSDEAPSISFLSAIAGFLLLAEVIKERLPGHRPPLNESVNLLSLGTLGRPHPELLAQWRPKRAGCDCTKEPWQRAYRRKWGEAGAPPAAGSSAATWLRSQNESALPPLEEWLPTLDGEGVADN